MFAKNLKYLRQLHNIDQLQLVEALGRKSASSMPCLQTRTGKPSYTR